jgi:FAD/FMN-containing dehydrogenase
MSIAEHTTLEHLGAGLRGAVITPEVAEYDAARRAWNGMVDRQPVAVVRAQGAMDVVAVVNFARETGLELAVRGGGHSTAGFSSTDGIVLDMSAMKGVWVDAPARTARAQAGALWADVDRETQAFGLAVPGGQVSHTGIAGLTLGGGIGWLSRQYGLTIDNLLSVDMVTADGRLVTASEREHPDLFWGIRGGSGNFGVVVSFEYRLHSVGPLVIGGPVVYELADARAAMRNAREFMATAPDNVSLWLSLTHVPPVAPFPESQWGEAILAVAPFCTDLERGPELLAPLTGFGQPILNLNGPLPYVALQSAIDAVNPHGDRYWDRGDYLGELPDELIDLLVAAAETMGPKCEILTFPMGGATARVPAEATAFGERTAPWDAWIIGQWTGPADDATYRDWVRGVSGSLEPWKTGGTYVNAIPDADAGEAAKAAAYGGAEKVERLREVKRAWDRENLFKRCHNVVP